MKHKPTPPATPYGCAVIIELDDGEIVYGLVDRAKMFDRPVGVAKPMRLVVSDRKPGDAFSLAAIGLVWTNDRFRHVEAGPGFMVAGAHATIYTCTEAAIKRLGERVGDG